MGLSLKSIGKGISKGLKKVGGAVTKVASFVPGPIGLAGSAANAAINHKPIASSVGGDLMRNAKGAAALLPIAASGGAAAGALGGAGGGLSLSSLGSLGSLGGAGGALKTVGQFALNNPDLILGGLSAAEGMDAARKEDRYRGKALAAAEQQYADAAPLRKAGLAGLLNETRPNLSSVFASSNPMARPFKRVGG
jgi:hypothetical protein